MFGALESTRLNVTSKSRSSILPWRGQFTPQLVDYLLEVYAKPGHRVLDPFCGSGTVLREAVSHKLKATGIEVNPAAYMMARFSSLCVLDQAARVRLVNSAEETLCSVMSVLDSNPPLPYNASYRENLLAVATEVLSRVPDRKTRLLLLLCLFRAENGRTSTRSIMNTLKLLTNQLMLLPHTENGPEVMLADARSSHLLVDKIDLIITSPPYINVFNYHQNHRAILELCGFDMLSVARSEIGSNRKHRANRFLTVVQYCLDLEMTLDSLAKCLAPNGLLIMVLGRESHVRRVPFNNSSLVQALINHSDAYSQCASYERVFVNRFGQSIREDVLITARQPKYRASTSVANDVARSLLQEASINAAGDVRTEIHRAINLCESVKPSPIFDWGHQPPADP